MKAVQWMMTTMMMTMMMTMTVCCDVTVLTVDGRLDVNVALNRPAYQSGVYAHRGSACIASKANDGNRNPIFDEGSCAHTGKQLNPWWAVDLVAALYVLGVKLTNRDTHGNTGLCA